MAGGSQSTGFSPPPSALIQELVWKTDAMREMAVSVCRLAIDRGMRGDFSALDLPSHGAAAHGGTGIAGSVFRILADAGVIAPSGVFVDGEFVQRRVRNAGGNPIGLWRLASHPLATTMIERYARQRPRAEQLVLGMMAEG